MGKERERGERRRRKRHKNLDGNVNGERQKDRDRKETERSGQDCEQLLLELLLWSKVSHHIIIVRESDIMSIIGTLFYHQKKLYLLK